MHIGNDTWRGNGLMSNRIGDILSVTLMKPQTINFVHEKSQIEIDTDMIHLFRKRS